MNTNIYATINNVSGIIGTRTKGTYTCIKCGVKKLSIELLMECARAHALYSPKNQISDRFYPR